MNSFCQFRSNLTALKPPKIPQKVPRSSLTILISFDFFINSVWQITLNFLPKHILHVQLKVPDGFSLAPAHSLNEFQWLNIKMYRGKSRNKAFKLRWKEKRRHSILLACKTVIVQPWHEFSLLFIHIVRKETEAEDKNNWAKKRETKKKFNWSHLGCLVAVGSLNIQS